MCVSKCYIFERKIYAMQSAGSMKTVAMHPWRPSDTRTYYLAWIINRKDQETVII